MFGRTSVTYEQHGRGTLRNPQLLGFLKHVGGELHFARRLDEGIEGVCPGYLGGHVFPW